MVHCAGFSSSSKSCPEVNHITLYGWHSNLLPKSILPGLDSRKDSICSASRRIWDPAGKSAKTSQWKYLGLSITERTIVPQQISINDNPKTLQELHQLCSAINWIRPLLGLTTEDLAPLFNLLRSKDELNSPRTLTPEAWGSICKVQKALSSKQAHRYDPTLPFKYILLGAMPYLYGLIFQWDEMQRDPSLIIEWVFLSHQPSKSITTPQEHMAKLIIKVGSRLRALARCDFTCIYLPVTHEALEHLLQNNIYLQFALDSFSGQISIRSPKHKLFNLVLKLIPK